MNTYQAIRDAMSIILTKDDSAIVFGEDVGFGGVFRCTLGLAEEFGRERVFNTPLTEYVVCAPHPSELNFPVRPTSHSAGRASWVLVSGLQRWVKRP